MSWRDLAACLGMDPGPFFSRGNPSVEVKALCDGCQVKDACLEAGLHEEFGVWGGLQPDDRRRLIKQRRVNVRASG